MIGSSRSRAKQEKRATWKALWLSVILILVPGSGLAAEPCPATVQQARKLLRQEEGLIPRRSRPLAGASTAPDLVKVAQLVEAAEQACRAGDMDGAKAKAHAAISELERKP